MFNLEEYVKKTLIDLYDKKVYIGAKVRELALNYMIKGVITQETVVEIDPNTKLPPINYSVHQVHQRGQFRCWVLMNNETGALIKEFHNDMDLCMFIEALKMSELGKIKEYVEREKNQGGWDV